MAQEGVNAIAAFAKDGTKPENTAGKTFVDTGVNLITDQPQTGVAVPGHHLRPAELLGLTVLGPAGRSAGRALPLTDREVPMASDVSSGDASSGGGTATRAPEPDTGFEHRKSESLGLRIQHVLHARPILGPLAVLLLSIIAFSIISGRFLSAANLGLVLAQVTVIAVLALGQTLVILTAGIDLSTARSPSSPRSSWPT